MKPMFVIRCGCLRPCYEARAGITAYPRKALRFASRDNAEAYRSRGVCNGGRSWTVVSFRQALESRR